MIGGVPAAPGTTMAQHKAAAESMKRTLDEDLATSIEKIGRAIGNLFTKTSISFSCKNLVKSLNLDCPFFTKT